MIARVPTGRIKCGRVPESKRLVFPQKPLQLLFLRIDDVVIREGLETAQRLPVPVATLGVNDTAAAKTEPFGENFCVQTVFLLLLTARCTFLSGLAGAGAYCGVECAVIHRKIDFFGGDRELAAGQVVGEAREGEVDLVQESWKSPPT